MFTDYGHLTIRTYTANGALPIANANIEIRSNERGNDISIFTIAPSGILIAFSPSQESTASPVLSCAISKTESGLNTTEREKKL